MHLICTHESISRQWAFEIACTQGCLQLAQWLWTNFHDDIDVGNLNSENSDVFWYVCMEGWVDVAKWLISDAHMPASSIPTSAFVAAFSFGHLDMAKYLTSLGIADIHVDDDLPFRVAVTHKHLDVAAWLISMGGVNIHAGYDESIRICVDNDYMDGARWLLAKEKNDAYVWPAECIEKLKTWGDDRRAWIVACVGVNERKT